MDGCGRVIRYAKYSEALAKTPELLPKAQAAVQVRLLFRSGLQAYGLGFLALGFGLRVY